MIARVYLISLNKKTFLKCWQHLSKQITTGRAPLHRVSKKVQFARTFVFLQTCNSIRNSITYFSYTKQQIAWDYTPVLLNFLNTQAKSYLQFFQTFSIHLSLLGPTPKNIKYQKLYLSSKLTTRTTLLIIGQFHYYQISIESSKKLCSIE